jgi:hypothetical protein
MEVWTRLKKARFKIIDAHRGREVKGHTTPGVSTALYLFFK